MSKSKAHRKKRSRHLLAQEARKTQEESEPQIDGCLVAPHVTPNRESSYFDYRFLDLANEDVENSTTHVWINAGAIIVLVAILAFLTLGGYLPHEAKTALSAAWQILKSRVFDETLFYVGLLAVAATSIDIYPVERLAGLEAKLQRKILDLHRVFLPSVKLGLVISGRGIRDALDWNMNTVWIVWVAMHYGPRAPRLAGMLWATMAATGTAKLLVLVARSCTAVISIGLFALAAWSAEFLNLWSGPSGAWIDAATFKWEMIYFFTAFFLWRENRRSESLPAKMVTWWLILGLSSPYLVVKCLFRIIPFLVFYPWYLLVRLAVLLKPKSLIRHLALALTILIALISRYTASFK